MIHRSTTNSIIRHGFLAVCSSLLVYASSQAATFTWNGNGSDNNWSTGLNWSGGIAPTNNGTAAIVLAGTNQLAPNVDAAWAIQSLTFNNTAGGFVLGGSTLTIGNGGVVNNCTNPQTISNAIALAANQTWSATSGSIVFAGNVNNNTNLLTVSGTSNMLISGVISGTGGLTKTGSGTNTLSGVNTYGGQTTVSAGVLAVLNGAALGATASGATVSSGAALQLQGGIVVTGENLTLSGNGIGGGGALRSVSGSNTWNGTITLAANSTIGCDAGTFALQANIINSTLQTTFTNAGVIIFNGVLGNGTGGFVKVGTGLLSLGGANTYSGTTTISGGTVQFSVSGGASSASAVTVNAGGTLDLNGFNETILSLAGAGSVTLGGGTLSVGNSAATTFSGAMSGTGSLIKAGAATMTLSGVNTYSGGTTINAGAISVAADTGLGNASGTLTLNGGTFTTTKTLASARAVVLGTKGGVISAGGTTLTLSGTISGPGFLTKIGTKTLALTGTNSYLGGTTNAAGTITIGSDAALGNPGGTLTFSNSATLTTTASFSSTRNMVLNAGTATFNTGTGFTNTFNGVISGAGALTKSGTGLLALGGNNTCTNTTTISAGTLQLGGNQGLSSLTPVKITAASATFAINGFNVTVGSLASTAAGKVTLGSGSLTAGGDNLSTTNSAVISGTGSFTKVGSGTMVLSGANTCTGATTVGAGTLKISANSRLASASPLVVSNGAVFNLNNFNQTIASLAGAGSVTLGSGKLTVGSAGTASFSGAISGTGALTKVGAGTQILAGANSYSGATTINVGNLQVTGSLPGSAVTISSGATLSGNGTVGSVAVNTGGTNAPGAGGAGTLSSGSQTWAGAGNFVWEINQAAGSQGSDPGWDWMNISGTLTINATAGSKFVIKVVSLNLSDAAGLTSNFDDTATYVWTIASASGGITGFNPAAFTIDTSAFQNPLGAGSFFLSQSGNNLNLVFTAAALAAIKDVQSGTLTSSGAGTNIATLAAAVNPPSAFLIFNTRHNSSVPGGSMIGGCIASSNSVEFVRVTSETSTMDIQWYVVEYSAGVLVQRGQVNQTNTTINVPLTPLAATNQAFVTWSKTPDPAETAFTDSDPVIGEITGTGNLQFRVGAAPSSVPVIFWQVIEFLNPASISVQQGSVTNLTGTNLLATATLAAPVNTNSTFLLTGYRTSGSGANVGARMLRAQWTGASTMAFDRSISGAPDDISEIAWQAVQLNDGSTVQGGSVTLANGIGETNVTLLSLDTNRAAAFASVQPVGGQNTGRSASTGSVLGVGSATLAVTSATQPALDRNDTGDQADVGWFVVGFGPGSLLTPATGGSAISADATGGAYTNLTGPVYTEIQNGNVGAGTIILKAPAGFVFNTSGPAPTVLITRVGGSGANSLNINGVASGTSLAMTSQTANKLTFTVASASSGGVTCSLTWQNVSVQPSAGTPLASGNLVVSGTAVIQGVTASSTSFGFLAEVVGAATQLGIQTAPSSSAAAGVEFAQQPVIQIEDQFGNLRNADDSTVVTAGINTGTGTLQGPATATAVGGIATFGGLSYQVAETIALSFTASGVAAINSGNTVVSPAVASQVALQIQPSAAATAGVVFSQQPAVQVQDQFGNLRNADNSTVVAASLDQGSGTLLGTLTATAANGVVTFTDLGYQVAETITIDFTSGTLTLATSSGTVVCAGAGSQLVIQTQPSSVAMSGVPFAQQPVILVEDQFGNLCSADNGTVVMAARDAGSGSGVLQGTLTATNVNGVATFVNLAHDVAVPISVDFNSGALTGATSSIVQVNPGTVARLAFSAQPGSAAVGSPFGVQPVVITQDAYGNGSISGLNLSLNVTLSLSSGAGSLLGTANLDIGLNTGNGVVTFSGLQINSSGNKQLTASASGLASAVSASFNVAQAALTVTATSITNQYGSLLPPLTVSYSGFVNGDTASVLSGSAAVSTTATTNSPVTNSPYPISVMQGTLSATNYVFSFVPGDVSVAPAPLGVTANDLSISYGSTVPTLRASYTGFVNGEDPTVLGGSAVLSTIAMSNSPVGSYPIDVGPGTLSDANYSYNLTNGALTITAAGLAVTNLLAVDKVYDGTTNAALDATNAGLEGVLNGNSVTLVASNAAAYFADKNVGTNKPVTVTGLALGGAGASNYAVVDPTI